MSRPNGFSRAYASVSVIAVMGLLAGCSQPATYATVDLSGSYAGNAPQAYSAASGLPVYRSTQGYTTPSFNNAAPAQNQLAYFDAPTNQVASLAPSYGGYAQPLPQSIPTFGSVVQGDTLTDETILRSDGFIDVGGYAGGGQYGGTQTASLAPGAGSISLGAMDAAPRYTPAPQGYAAPQYTPAPPAMVQAAPMAEPVPYDEPLTVIEASPLPAPEMRAAPAPVAPPAFVGNDYANIADGGDATTVEQPVAYAAPVYTPTVSSIESTPLDMMEAPAEDFAGWDQPARDDVAAVTKYFDLRKEQTDGTVQQAALPMPNAVPSAPAQTLRTPAPSAGGGLELTRPIASEQYVRPYDALPPGFYPPYEFGPAADDALISQAPPVQFTPQFVAFEPPAPVAAPDFYSDMPLEQASVATTFGGTAAARSHMVQSGDTLYSIARQYGIPPQFIAQRNGIELGGTIYPGNTLAIPDGELYTGGPDTLGDAPIVVLKTAQADIEQATGSTYTRDLTDQSVEMLDLAEIAQMYKGREGGGGSMPIISAEAGAALRGHTDMTPVERFSSPSMGLMASVPPVAEAPVSYYDPAPTPVARTATPSYAWPVHGEVYRLSAGQIEIEAGFGESVKASAGGRVVHVENGPRGYLIVIEHDDGWRSLTLGLSGAVVAQGQRVTEGTTLGLTGMDRIRFELRDTNANIAETLGVLRS